MAEPLTGPFQLTDFVNGNSTTFTKNPNYWDKETLSGQSYIEADTMPTSTLPRTARAGELPPAIAMVSFGVDKLPETLEYLSPPQTLPAAPYHGRRAAVCVGPAGELVELIARGQ